MPHRIRDACFVALMFAASCGGDRATAVAPSPTPTIVVDSTVLLTAAAGAGTGPVLGLRVTNRANGAVSVAIASIQYDGDGPAWLIASLSDSTTPATLTLQAAPTQFAGTCRCVPIYLGRGTYRAHLSLTSATPGVSNSPIMIAVTLTVGLDSAVKLNIGGTAVAVDSLSPSLITIPFDISNVGSDGAMSVSFDSATYAPGALRGWLSACAVASSQILVHFGVAQSTDIEPGGHRAASCVANTDSVSAAGTFVATAWFSGFNAGAASAPVSMIVQSPPIPAAHVDVQLGASQLRVGDTTSCVIRVSDAKGRILDRDFAVTVAGDGELLASCATTNGKMIGATPGNVQVTVAAGKVRTTVPVTISPAGPPLLATMVSAGTFFSCAVTTATVLYCWGDDPAPRTASPTRVVTSVTFSAISLGNLHACGLHDGGRLACWGNNSVGQFGTGDRTNQKVPTDVPTALKFSAISAGINHTCAISTSQDAYCWGFQLDDSAGGDALTPKLIPGGFKFTTITTRELHTCALTSSGAAYCWGVNADGELGDSTHVSRSIPAPVAGGLSFRTIGVGNASTCGLTVDHLTYCWGSKITGGSDGSSMVPTLVPGPTFEDVIVGLFHACGITSDGSAYCWGYNVGQLGDGTTISRAVPTPVAGNVRFRSLAADDDQTCGIAVTGALYCWGSNSYGEVGDRVHLPRRVPFPVAIP